MKYSEAKQGRIFVIRLEDGDIVHKEIESFAKNNCVKAAGLIIIGGADKSSKLITGPKQARKKPIIPMEYVLDNVHEITGTGTIFPNKTGEPVLHMHIACGRRSKSLTGCVRRGVKVWHVMEVILFELVHTQAARIFEQNSGLELMNP